MLNCDIIYDTREPREFVDWLKKYMDGYTFASKHMEVGDYIVNGTVIERKDVDDYLKSMQEGRLNNQLASLSASGDISYLVIIGDIFESAYDNNITRPAVISSLIGDSFKRSIEGKQGVVVTIQLETRWDFIFFLKYLHSKDKIRTPKLGRLKVPKSEYLVQTLRSIPGWGNELAKEALKKFGTLENVFSATKDDLKSIYGCGEVKANNLIKHLKERYE